MYNTVSQPLYDASQDMLSVISHSSHAVESQHCKIAMSLWIRQLVGVGHT